MRQLSDCFEGLLDADYDIDDSAILTDLIKKVLGYEDDYEVSGHKMPTIKTDGEWIVFDCIKCKRHICFGSINPLKAVGYKKFRLINCDCLTIYPENSDPSTWSDFEIDAPGAEVFFDENGSLMELTNVKLNSNILHIRNNIFRGDAAKVTMKGCKFDTAMIDFYTIDQLSIADTCKFPHCKLLFLGRIGKSIARGTSVLHMGDAGNGQSFEQEIETRSWEYQDKTKYQGIDVMKTLGLKANKWSDLGKIVITPAMRHSVGTPGICLYKLSKAMSPLSNIPNGEIVEFKDGWSGQHVRNAYMEQNGVVK